METTDLKELIVMPVPRKDGTVSLRLCLTQGELYKKALSLIEKAVLFYKQNGKKRERTSAMVERVGKDALLKAVQ